MSGFITRLRKHPRVETVDDERGIGNGVIVTLKAGWTFDPRQDNRVAGEDTARKALELVCHHSFKFKGELTA